MRWPHPPRTLTPLLVAVSLCCCIGSALADPDSDRIIYVSGEKISAIVSHETYLRAGQGDQLARYELQLQLFSDAYILAASERSVMTGTRDPGALESLERVILWPVGVNGKAWPVLDHGKNTFGWNQWPRIEYDSRVEHYNVGRAFLSEDDRLARLTDWNGRIQNAERSLGSPLSPDVLEARLPVLLLQPVWAYYRMHGELPATPGEAYRELGVAMLDQWELELLEHYTLEFYSTVGRIQLRLEPRDPEARRLEALAWVDADLGTVVIQGRQLAAGDSFTENEDFPLRLQIQRFKGQKTSTDLLPEMQLWSSWREADIPVIATPVTDFLRHGPTIPQEDLMALAQDALREEALRASRHSGPYFEKAESGAKSE